MKKNKEVYRIKPSHEIINYKKVIPYNRGYEKVITIYFPILEVLFSEKEKEIDLDGKVIPHRELAEIYSKGFREGESFNYDHEDLNSYLFTTPEEKYLKSLPTLSKDKPNILSKRRVYLIGQYSGLISSIEETIEMKEDMIKVIMDTIGKRINRNI